jgi:hypothetical protein
MSWAGPKRCPLFVGNGPARPENETRGEGARKERSPDNPP